MPIDYTRHPPHGDSSWAHEDSHWADEDSHWSDAGAGSPPWTPPPAPPARRRPLLIVVTSILILVLLSGGFFVVTKVLGAESDPTEVELPAVATGVEATALQDYLNGTGAPLVAFVGALPADLAGEADDRCAGLASRLQAAGTPQRLAEIADGVPDPAVRDTSRAALTATGQFLGGCLAGAAEDVPREETEFQRIVLMRMLEQNGISM